MSAVLELRGVVREFPGHRAVDGISVELERGGFYSLLGPSGCGKTTTLRLIGGFERPDSGSVFLNGRDVSALPPWQRNVSTVFQSYALFPHLTALGNVEFGLRESRAANSRERAREALKRVQLSGKADCYPASLSGGEKQRVALARSLVLEPEILLLDEPLAALDPKLRTQMRGELKTLQRNTGITFLLVTHDQEEALSLSDKLAVMNAGAIEQFDTPEAVYLKPATRFVASFIGALNWFGGTGVRPESTRVSRSRPADGPCVPAFAESVVFLGDCSHLNARLETGERVVSQLKRGCPPFQRGDAIFVHWNEADEIRFE